MTAEKNLDDKSNSVGKRERSSVKSFKKSLIASPLTINSEGASELRFRSLKTLKDIKIGLDKANLRKYMRLDGATQLDK